MDTYMMAAGDVETGLQHKPVVLVEKRSSTGWMGKVFLCIFMVALCCGGALFFRYWNGRQEPQGTQGTQEPQVAARHHHYDLSYISNTTKAAIHLEGSLEKLKNGTEVLEWTKDQGQAFAQGGFKLSHNSIIIPKTGLYFVYSQASFRVSCEDDKASGSVLAPLSHSVRRYSDSIGDETSLLSAVRSACQRPEPEGAPRDGHGWYNAIYLGAVFKLNVEDKLWTETNRLSQLETDEGKNFFGVFAL